MPAEVDGARPEQRILEAESRLPVDAAAAVTGWAALRWLGVQWLDGCTGPGHRRRDVVVVCATRDLATSPGVTLSAERLGPHEVVEVDGVRVTTAVRSVVFELRYAGWVEAVIAADMACRADLVSRAEIAAYLADHGGWTGVPGARRVLEAVVENSWSPGETRARLACRDAGIDGLLCNIPVFDRRGRLLGTPDLLDEAAGVAIEYDGAHHHEGRQRHLDVKRESVLRDAGLEYVTLLGPDVRDPDGLARRVLAARQRARWESAATRAWTIDLPRGYRSRRTVAERRRLAAYAGPA